MLYKKLILLRKNEDLLRRGDYRTISAQKGSKLYVFERYNGDKSIRIFINMGDKAVSIKDFMEGFCELETQGLQESILNPKGFAILKN